MAGRKTEMGRIWQKVAEDFMVPVKRTGFRRGLCLSFSDYSSRLGDEQAYQERYYKCQTALGDLFVGLHYPYLAPLTRDIDYDRAMLALFFAELADSDGDEAWT